MNCLKFCAGNISPLSFTLSFTKPPFSWFVQVISMGLGMGNCQTSCQDRVYYLLLAWKGLVTSSTQLNTWNSWIWLLKSEFILSIVFFLTWYDAEVKIAKVAENYPKYKEFWSPAVTSQHNILYSWWLGHRCKTVFFYMGNFNTITNVVEMFWWVSSTLSGDAHSVYYFSCIL